MSGENRSSFVILALGAALGLSGCTKKAPVIETHSPTAEVFSNRPIQPMTDLTVVTFASPPILAVATKTKTGWVVPADAKQKILDEQTQFETNLKKIDPSAQIIYRYRMTVNGAAVFTSADLSSQLLALPGVKAVSSARQMARSQDLNISDELDPRAATGVNSVNFIGADKAHQLGYTGQGMRVGIIDTGIDYTHAMLGGPGKKEVYKAIDPAQPNPLFPNDKVVGGIDLVGSAFDASSENPSDHLPRPDNNPLDEAGHGSHVAGTIAGVGDGVSTYSGVAPDAKLYAIKVFGKSGSTADAAVIAGFEFAADPNGDLNPDDQLDVVNLSLGGAFGQPQELYTESVGNLSRAGTVVVAAAGNAGPEDYIVGAPSTTEEAISVAASIDGADVNWRFNASQLHLPSTPNLLVKAVEGNLSRPIAQSSGIGGTLVDIGDASADLTDEQNAQLAGHVALIARGKVSFADKLKRAVSGGAIGAVVYNNAPGSPIPMGGDTHFDIPAIMVSQALGQQILTEIKTGPVSIQFQTNQTIDEPQNIDTITSFSSKGPRSEDNLIKPEIAAPGQNIISVSMGTGNQGIKMDGTSMASPHMTGALTLIKQAHAGLTSRELKSLAMNTAKLLDSAIPITLQGAGRIQLVEAIQASVVSDTPSISLGRVQIENTKQQSRSIQLRNLTNQPLTLSVTTQTTAGMSISVPNQVTVPASGTTTVVANFTLSLSAESSDQFTYELDGHILFKDAAQKTVVQIPAMAIRTEASLLSLTGSTDTVATKGGSLRLVNTSPNTGVALAFNLLGQDAPKANPAPAQAWENRSCDLQSVGYRIVRKDTGTGSALDMIQFAFKIFNPVTTWHLCSVSVLIDSNGDGVADQELAGVTGSGLSGVQKAAFASVLLDAAKARSIRLAYEQSVSIGKPVSLDYTPAVQGIGPMAAFDQSSLAVVEVPLTALAKGTDGQLHIKLASQAEGGQTFEADKYLGGPLGTWYSVTPDMQAQSFYNMEELTEVPQSGANLQVTKGSDNRPLVIYYPLNEMRVFGQDGQQQIVGGN